VQFTKIDQALAAINLLGLGFDVASAKSLSIIWRERQLDQSLSFYAERAGRLKVVDELGPSCAGKMFLSFHYSVYPSLMQALAKKTGDSKIFSLIGRQAKEHGEHLKALAHSKGVDLNFVSSGFHMVSELRMAMALGHAGFMLLDVPWSKRGTNPDKAYKTSCGEFMGLLAVERLLALISKDWIVVTTSREVSGMLRLKSFGNIPIARAFSLLGEQINKDPTDYERLHQMHKFCRLKSTKPQVVSFRVDGQRYAIYGPDMRAVKVSNSEVLDLCEETKHGVCDQSKLVSDFSRAIGSDIKYVLCI
jgi:hypothetical protein